MNGWLFMGGLLLIVVVWSALATWLTIRNAEIIEPDDSAWDHYIRELERYTAAQDHLQLAKAREDAAWKRMQEKLIGNE